MFRIGDFARLAQVTAKALRLYDRLGLLKPATIDRFTDYRYYTLDQLPRLNRIIALKDLGFSLEQIGRMLDRELPTAELRGMLRLKQAELEQHARAALDRVRRVAARLKQIELEDIMPDYEVVLKRIQSHVNDPDCLICQDLKRMGGLPKPDGDVLRVTESYGPDESGRVWFNKKIEAPDLPAETSPPGPMFFIRSGSGATHPPPFPLPHADQLVVLPFVEAHALPGVESAATTLHSGERDTIALACRALVDWISANGYRVAGHYQERVLREGALYECVIPVIRES